jgi:hypothetical protein
VLGRLSMSRNKITKSILQDYNIGFRECMVKHEDSKRDFCLSGGGSGTIRIHISDSRNLTNPKIL